MAAELVRLAGAEGADARAAMAAALEARSPRDAAGALLRELGALVDERAGTRAGAPHGSPTS